MKKVGFLIICSIFIATLFGCNHAAIPAAVGVEVGLENSSNKTYEVTADLHEFRGSEEISLIISSVSVEAGKIDNVCNDAAAWKSPEKLYTSFSIKDEEGTVVYKAVGYPEEWKTNPPEGWTVPADDYDRYGIGYLDKALYGEKRLNVIDDEGNIEQTTHCAYFYVTIDENNQITVTYKKHS